MNWAETLENASLVGIGVSVGHTWCRVELLWLTQKVLRLARRCQHMAAQAILREACAEQAMHVAKDYLDGDRACLRNSMAELEERKRRLVELRRDRFNAKGAESAKGGAV